MDDRTSLGGDPRMEYAVERMKDLRREAANERLARSASSGPALEALRRRVGRYLIGIGAGIVGSVDASRMRVDPGRGEEPWTA
jgi:hypothetical protein